VPVSFSSYALVLMTIGFLQMRRLLPNLQEAFDGLDNTREGIYWQRRKNARIQCDIRHTRADGWVPPTNVELEDVLFDWFNYWGHEHAYGRDVVDIRKGSLILRDTDLTKLAGMEVQANRRGADIVEDLPTHVEDDDMPPGTITPVRWDDDENDDLPELLVTMGPAVPGRALAEGRTPLEDELPKGWANICVMDPFIRTKNVTRQVGPASVVAFRKECQSAALFLRWGRPLDDLLSGVASKRRQSPSRDLRSSRSASPEGKRPVVNEKAPRRPDWVEDTATTYSRQSGSRPRNASRYPKEAGARTGK